MSRRASLTALATSIAAAIVLLGACASGQSSASVSVPSPTSPAVTSACDAMHGELPSAVDGNERRDATPASLLTAAWGEPPITWRCGVGSPAGFNSQSQVLAIDGVSWFGSSGSDGSTVFTTVGRQARVEVVAPKSVSPASDVLLDLAQPILDHNPTI